MALIKAIVQKKEKTLIAEFPNNIYNLYGELQSIGITKPPQKVFISDDDEHDIRVKLYADSDIGNHLILLFNEKNSIADVNTAANAVRNSHEAIQDDLEQNILYDQYDTAEEMIADIRSMTYDAGTVSETFYFPLSGTIYDAEDDEVYEIDNRTLAANEDKIKMAIEEYIESDDYNMANFYDEAGKEKLLAADWGLEYIGDTLYGKVDIRLTEAMTDKEKAEFKDWISGQNSDGAGEGFEQQDIDTDDGALNVSFWHSGDDYFIYDQEEMDEYIKQQGSMQMGGM